MINTIYTPFLPINMTKKQIKLKNQFLRVSHFLTLRRRGAPGGVPKILLTPKIFLTSAEWPNWNLETVLGSIGHSSGAAIDREILGEIIASPPPPY
jgi:hypothetical protein